MTLESIKREHDRISSRSQAALDGMDAAASESYRVADVAADSEKIINDLEAEFESAAGLQKADVAFLFVAVGLQLARIAVMNELTRIEKAGQGNTNEKRLHDVQAKILEKLFTNGGSVTDRPYYASVEHIISTKGVPYDATNTLTMKSISRMMEQDKTWSFDLGPFMPKEKLHLFGGANHRFSTLGHDPVLGLFFGTCNIMTNTITCVKDSAFTTVTGIPVLTTNHVVYTESYSDPRIAVPASTAVMAYRSVERVKESPQVLAASLIKQVIHIGTDMYTPSGIQIPAANLILTNAQTEKLTKYISTGDLVKVSASAGIAELINMIIAVFHTLMYDPLSGYSRDLYNIRTRKIITYSNMIATGSNALWVGANMMLGRNTSLRQLDIGGLLVVLKHLRDDKQYIRRIKEEFVFGHFNQMIRGDV